MITLTYIDISTCNIHTINAYAGINRKMEQRNVYSAPRRSEVRQNKVTATEVRPRLVKRCRYAIYKHISTYYATASYPVLTTSEIPAKLSL